MDFNNPNIQPIKLSGALLKVEHYLLIFFKGTFYYNTSFDGPRCNNCRSQKCIDDEKHLRYPKQFCVKKYYNSAGLLVWRDCDIIR